jgi:hypothetical protein
MPLAVVLEEAIVQARRQILDGDEQIEIAVAIVVTECRAGGVYGKVLHTALSGFVLEDDGRWRARRRRRGRCSDGHCRDDGHAKHGPPA